MKTVKVKTKTPYDVAVGKGLLSSVGKYIKGTLGECRVCIVSDKTVAALYGEALKTSLDAESIYSISFTVEAGEDSKTPENLLLLLEHLAANEFSRSDIILALGGGVVGDLGGFAASVYLRGIRFVGVPTTLLAMVDSSVGGKTAVNLSAGKNLMGSFHQPSLVICDTDTLKSLPDNVFSDGCAEVIKYGAINDRDFFNELKTGISKKLENVIVKCIQSKADTVKRDERDNGCRRLLNFGHTVGHAIELRSNFSLSHGSAVAIGMVTMTRAAVNMGICPKEDLDELIALLDSNGLPTSCPFAAKELTRTALIDKKRSGDSICIILPYGIGNCKAVSVSVSSLADIFEKGLEQ